MTSFNIHEPNVQNLLVNKEQLQSELDEGPIIISYDSEENLHRWNYTIVYIKSLKCKVKVYNKIIFCNDVRQVHTDIERKMSDHDRFDENNSLDDFKKPTYKQYYDMFSNEQLFTEYKLNSKYWYYTDKYTFKVFRENKYKFIPKIVFETENYLGFEYTDCDPGWRKGKPEDLIVDVLDMPVTTNLCKNIFRELYTFQLNEQIDLPEIDYDWWYNQLLVEPNIAHGLKEENIPRLAQKQKPGITYRKIIPEEIYIKDFPGDNLEWKFTAVENIMFQHGPNTKIVASDVWRDEYDDVNCAYHAGVGEADGVMRIFYNGEWLTRQIPV